MCRITTNRRLVPFIPGDLAAFRFPRPTAPPLPSPFPVSVVLPDPKHPPPEKHYPSPNPAATRWAAGPMTRRPPPAEQKQTATIVSWRLMDTAQVNARVYKKAHPTEHDLEALTSDIIRNTIGLIRRVCYSEKSIQCTTWRNFRVVKGFENTALDLK